MKTQSMLRTGVCREWTPSLRPAIRAATAAACMVAATSGLVPSAHASSHSDAPLIKLDPQANLTDLYAFIRTRPSDNQKVLVVEVSVRPFCEPGDGVMYEAFSPDARYSIHITNPVTGAENQRYDFNFSPVTPASGKYKNTGTILRYGLGTELGPIQTVGDARQNFTQTYTVTKTAVADKKGKPHPDGKDEPGKETVTLLNGPTPLLVAPPNVGKNTTPLYNDANGVAVSGAATRATLDPYTFQTTYDLPGGTTVFCGPRDDGFFADTAGIFDLLEGRILDSDGDGDGLGQEGNGVDGFKGYNVLHYGIVIPVSDLQTFAYTGALQAPSTGVGVYASVSRPQETLRRANGEDKSSGPYIQVNRLGNPLFNEVLVALVDKDAYNRTSPPTDAVLYAKYAKTPELAVLLNTVFGTHFVTNNRTDLVSIFIPDVLRVNTTTGATPVAGESAFNRLSFIGGDTILNGDGVAIPAGWPNGRRFGDDVVDIALTAIASGPTFSTITVVGDNVPANDETFNRTFPYAATPHSGPRNSKDSGVNVGF